jgi:hypothetical protein
MNLATYYEHKQTKNSKMDITCSAHGKDEKYIQNLEARDLVEEIGIDGSIIL